MTSRAIRSLAVLSIAVASWPLTHAQQTTGVDSEHRLFLRFAEDAAIVPSYWLEGQARLELSLPAVDETVGGAGEADLLTVGPVFAFNVAEDFEFGGRVGMAWRDPDDGGSDTGLTDFDIWGKIAVVSDPIDIALGILVKLPTADESKLMGTGETDVEFFAGVRKNFTSFTVAGNLGFRINQDPEFDDLGEVEGKDSVLAGLAIIVPIGAKWALTGEWAFESERIEDFDNDSRLFGGAEYRWDESFSFRGGAAIGLSDGSPDWDILGSAVWLF